MTKAAPLKIFVKKYFDHDPIVAAHELEALSAEDAVSVLKALSSQRAAEAVNLFHDAYAVEVLQKLPEKLFQDVAAHLDPQHAASLFRQCPDVLREQFLGLLDKKRKQQIHEFLTYPDDSVGQIMTTDFIAFHADVKVKDAIHRIRQLAQKGSTASYIYVVDKDNRITGVLRMRDMLLSSTESLLENIMRKEIFKVHCFDEVEKVASELSARKYFAAPVVDGEGRLLGVVKAEKLIGEVQSEATEDIQKMFGASGNERAFSPIGFSLKTRLPWLHVNLVTAFLAASVVALFEDIIAKITVLAVFLPVVAGQGGNAGAQSLAIVMRGLVMREIPPNKVKNLILKETCIGAINGIVIGVVTGLVAWVWKGNPHLGLVIGLGMLVNLAIAGLAGAAIPLAMKAIRLDPAQCSNIILTTVTDVMGFFAFLGFAVLFQDYLI